MKILKNMLFALAACTMLGSNPIHSMELMQKPLLERFQAVVLEHPYVTTLAIAAVVAATVRWAWQRTSTAQIPSLVLPAVKQAKELTPGEDGFKAKPGHPIDNLKGALPVLAVSDEVDVRAFFAIKKNEPSLLVFLKKIYDESSRSALSNFVEARRKKLDDIKHKNQIKYAECILGLLASRIKELPELPEERKQGS